MKTKTQGRQLRARIAGLAMAVLFLSGCAEMPTWIPFQGYRSNEIPGLVTPAQKMDQLKKLRLDAPDSSPAFKQQVVDYLTSNIRTETDPLIRGEIIRTLSEYPIPSAAPVLKAAIQDSDMEVRMAACDAWGKLSGEDSAELLVKVLKNDTEKDVRLAAARALGRTRDQRAIVALGEVLDENDPAMQYRAVLALKEVTGQDLGNRVDLWQQYAREGKLKPAEPTSVADKMKKMFY